MAPLNLAHKVYQDVPTIAMMVCKSKIMVLILLNSLGVLHFMKRGCHISLKSNDSAVAEIF